MSEDDQPASELAQPPKPAEDRKPAADRPTTGYSYFPASPITPGRWNPADLRIRRTTRRSP